MFVKWTPGGAALRLHRQQRLNCIYYNIQMFMETSWAEYISVMAAKSHGHHLANTIFQSFSSKKMLYCYSNFTDFSPECIFGNKLTLV